VYPKAESVNEIAYVIFSGFRFVKEDREIQKTLYEGYPKYSGLKLYKS
jgi:hypothetical protein